MEPSSAGLCWRANSHAGGLPTRARTCRRDTRAVDPCRRNRDDISFIGDRVYHDADGRDPHSLVYVLAVGRPVGNYDKSTGDSFHRRGSRSWSACTERTFAKPDDVGRAGRFRSRRRSGPGAADSFYRRDHGPDWCSAVYLSAEEKVSGTDFKSVLSLSSESQTEV